MFVPERSNPALQQYLFAYQVTISNQSERTVQLVSRHWVISDALGQTEEVRGPGVVGEQPLLSPGESFTYTSACPLPTTSGTMRGSYQMVAEDGETFDAEVAPFSMVIPAELN